MATNNFITNTASLKTTIADIRKLDAKKINAQTIFLGGENIRDLIDNATPTIKHSQDTRETVTENDLWGQWVETKDDGTIIVHDDWVTNPNTPSSYDAWNTAITKVEDNKAYTSSGFYANIQTEQIKDCNQMFYKCTKLTDFSSDLSSMTTGTSMFNQCSGLTSFYSDLSSLTSGNKMFYKCKLDAESVLYIADTIKDITAEKQLYSDGSIPGTILYVTQWKGKYTAPQGFMPNGNYVYTYNKPEPTTTTISASNVGKLTLGINVVNNADTIQQQLEDFAKAATFDSWEDLKTHFSNKGWTVTFQYGGSSDTITYDLRNGEQIIPCPIFAKLVQVEDKDSAQYCTEDASSFYNIEWGHDVTDTTDYTQFNSLEDAMTSWNVFPKENIITTEE